MPMDPRQFTKGLFAGLDGLFATPLGPRVLIYHSVGRSGRGQLEVGLTDFVWQLDWLEANSEIVAFDHAISSWTARGSERLTVLTFDDGFRDTYEYAFPILSERGLPFVLYLSTSLMGNDEYLRWDHVQEMAASGLATIGAHTHTHRDLRTSREEVLDELVQSDLLIKSHIGSSPRHFAYPWGYWSAEAESIVKTRYESAALGAPPARLRSAATFDPYRIHRHPVQGSDGIRWFEPRMRGGLVLEERTRRLIRGYRGP